MKKFYILLVALFLVNGSMGQWVPQNSGTTNYLYSGYFTDTNTGYAVGDSGTILKTTNGGGYPVGLNDLSAISNTLNIYPNPSSTYINIESAGTGQLSILNLNGQEIIIRQITEPKTILDISNLPSGVYFVRKTNEHNVEVGKIIKK